MRDVLLVVILVSAIIAMKKLSENHDQEQITDGLTIYDIICLAAQLALEVFYTYSRIDNKIPYFSCVCVPYLFRITTTKSPSPL